MVPLVTCFSVGGGGGAHLGADGGDADEERERGTARDVALIRGGVRLLGFADEQLAAARGGQARRRAEAGGGLVEEAGGGRHGYQAAFFACFLPPASGLGEECGWH